MTVILPTPVLMFAQFGLAKTPLEGHSTVATPMAASQLLDNERWKRALREVPDGS
jgi:hypothetical protein